MRTLDLNEAASLLKVHPKTLQRMARACVVPACKVGRAWVFVESLLTEHLVKLSTARLVPVESLEHIECPSTNAKIRPSGGSSSRPFVASRDLYSKALGLPTSDRRSRSTTGSPLRVGNKTASA